MPPPRSRPGPGQTFLKHHNITLHGEIFEGVKQHAINHGMSMPDAIRELLGMALAMDPANYSIHAERRRAFISSRAWVMERLVQSLHEIAKDAEEFMGKIT